MRRQSGHSLRWEVTHWSRAHLIDSSVYFVMVTDCMGYSTTSSPPHKWFKNAKSIHARGRRILYSWLETMSLFEAAWTSMFTHTLTLKLPNASVTLWLMFETFSWQSVNCWGGDVMERSGLWEEWWVHQKRSQCVNTSVYIYTVIVCTYCMCTRSSLCACRLLARQNLFCSFISEGFQSPPAAPCCVWYACV